MSKDLFSKQSSLYAIYRPTYPDELYRYILSFVENKSVAWDCATGNGQAAAALAPNFKTVYATDISEGQLKNAVKVSNIIYSRQPAEKTTFDDNSIDLITVAQAYHWFDFSAFEHEVKRVAKNGSVIAIWGYGLIYASDVNVDQLIQYFYKDVTAPYWDPERRYVDEQYLTIPFPYHELPTKGFTIERHWTLEEFANFLRTWSSVQNFIKKNGIDPVDDFTKKLKEIWNDESAIRFNFPVFLRIGTIQKA
jgi:ubiquinone/menaquinone biosynthesis C-methylase UbiE